MLNHFKPAAQLTGETVLRNSPLNTSHPLPENMSLPTRPSRWQEIMRQWILLLPLATAIAGAALTATEETESYLPAIFFTGALLVTAAMLHQRRLYALNLTLVERCVTNERLTNLHRLALGLNKSLDTVQVAQTVITHALESLSVENCALWLRSDFIPAGLNTAEASDELLQPVLAENPGLAEKQDAGERRHWCRIASHGFEAASHAHLLEEWNTALHRGDGQDAQHHYRIKYGVANCAILEKLLDEHDSAIATLILWEGEVVGSLLVARRDRRLQADDAVLLDAIALAAAPALQNARVYQEANSRADRDGVTGLYNHRAIQEQLGKNIARAARTSGELGVIMMDLNNFKFFNDTYGHPVGDQVLRTVARSLAAAYRTSDVVGRFGGDEFIALLPDTNEAGVIKTCRRLASLLDEQHFTTEDGTRIPINMSFGWAVFPHDADTALGLISQADSVLYENKRHGNLSYLTGSPDVVQVATDEVRHAYRTIKQREDSGGFGVLDALVTAIDNKDHYTRRHSEEVTGLALLIAKEIGLPEEEVQTVCISGLLHDVGKIAVPDHILRHPGKLTDEEFKIMQQHPIFGALIVKDVPHLEPVLEGVRYHHERWDGRGYPDNLTGTDIPLMGRLLAVPDCYSAMTTDRPYRKALTTETALAEIEKGKNTQFDPIIADAFVRVIGRMELAGDATVLPEFDLHNPLAAHSP